MPVFQADSRNYLFSQFAADENREVEARHRRSANPTVVLKPPISTVPRFKSAGLICDAKVIEMNITINDEQEKFEFSQLGVLREINRDTVETSQSSPIEGIATQSGREPVPTLWLM